MDAAFLERGLIIGLSIAAPVGPVSLLCIRRTLAEGRLSGIVSGLGAATADAAFGCVAGLGLTYISNIMIDQRSWLRLIGGLFLCYLGIRLLLARPAEQTALPTKGNGLIYAYASTLLLTLTNPMTILSFAAFFAGLGLASAGNGYASSGALVLGVFIGSAIWWLILSSAVGAFRERCSQLGLQWVNRISGAMIAGFGLAALFC
jgi:threonine/homoserine/homoserine lactone efflux protein